MLDITSNPSYFFIEEHDKSPTRRGSLAAVKLLHAYKIWAKQRGAEDICVHVTSGGHLKQTDKLMRKLGFMQTGGNYTY